MKKDIFIFIVILIVVTGLAAGAATFYNKYFKPNEVFVSCYDTADTVLVIEGDVISENNPPVVRDGQILLPFDTIKKYIDPYIWWDEALQKVTVTTSDKVIKMETDKLDAYINNEPIELKFPATQIDGVVYLPIEFLASFYKINVRYSSSSNVVIIDRQDVIHRIGYPVSTGAVVRKGRNVRYPIIKKFEGMNLNSEDSKIYIFEEYDKWYKVRTAEGYIGYIRKEDIVIKSYEIGIMPEKIRERPKLPEGKISLVWDQMYSPTKAYLERKREEGIDVMSPTWFQVANRDGELINRADPQYVEWAHRNGYQVWALVANDFSNIDDTSEILNNGLKREYVIKQILAFAALYELDGINIDFENIYKSDKDAFTQFVRELTPLLREQGLVVSVDVTVPGGSDTWSLCYDRKALAETVDYVCLMTYDQTWAGSRVAGSTAQIGWVEENVKKTLKEVPAEKLLLGIPLYTRLWEETADENGKITAKTGKALSINAAELLIRENNAVPVWDSESGQYVVTFEKDNKTYKMWLENEYSVNLKSSLVHKYNLAGTATWSHNFANDSVWAVYDRNLKKTSHYEEWKSNFASLAETGKVELSAAQ
ncbi:putative sporulation-specific glycosylase [Thermoclostridium stercorarium subsp. stercorarium DSM 8532]|uniref:Glycoside hydrolase n=2 Tax=Thermoclostridium stercorarium TaxID=1510 RepID=A0A1B1YNE6_THEST|nr:glycosyl hydrolase family 18 protein [Thermoclostridium stercorarium]AGC69431.1 putative sporulation-specific glycosylase [Thermoclostridium stercorarium subsp. stercorarium DSM 8532]AGI40389.1 chitinase [Thermoclostridium stercorarium subsp. stercorarium DSM 8532]ANX02305.1 glycoside hydrolase [Thermoclostridium stercorarium subsp. leptospartum DSM 9219]